MTATLAGALLTAGALGATHALEPDHVAGISSLTGRYEDARLSAFVGACFGAGHVALVAGWLALAHLILGRTSFPAALDTAGTLAAAALLAALGTVLAVRGYRAAARAHARTDHDGRDGHHHDHADHRDHDHHAHGADPHLHLPLVGGHDHDHTTRAYLKTGLVGALFTLSPPLSMMAFAGTLLPTYGAGAVALAVLAYAVSITLTMAAVGAGVGTVFQLSGRHGRAYGAVRAAVGLGVVAFAAVLGADALALV